jgi:hypothetical protein
MLSICRETLYKWLEEGRFAGVEYKGLRGWYLFADEQLNRVIEEYWKESKSSK